MFNPEIYNALMDMEEVWFVYAYGDATLVYDASLMDC
jgi:hypothetical protein